MALHGMAWFSAVWFVVLSVWDQSADLGMVWYIMAWFGAVWHDVLPVWDEGAKLGCTVGNVDGGWV